MTDISTTPTSPRRSALDHRTAMRLAAQEYRRYLDVLTGLDTDDWARPTDCPRWDVRAMAAHNLGMAELAASVREGRRQVRTATHRGGVMIDALTALQVEEHAGLTPAQLVDRYAAVIPRAARGRRWTPGFMRRRRVPQEQIVGGRPETWTVGFLVDTILTRDTWMHRVDTCRATGREMVLTADHDAVIVADVVDEWAGRHGAPFRLRLTGPAGGSWAVGTGGPDLELDAVEFCRTLSRRSPATGLLDVEVPF
jgi:uncharacterized protein (TIGR03083 family)